MVKLENGALTRDHIFKLLHPGTFLCPLLEFLRAWYAFFVFVFVFVHLNVLCFAFYEVTHTHTYQYI